MQNPRYTFCGKFIPEYQLRVLLWWLHHDDATCTLDTDS